MSNSETVVLETVNRRVCDQLCMLPFEGEQYGVIAVEFTVAGSGVSDADVVAEIDLSIPENVMIAARMFTGQMRNPDDQPTVVRVAYVRLDKFDHTADPSRGLSILFLGRHDKPADSMSMAVEFWPKPGGPDLSKHEVWRLYARAASLFNLDALECLSLNCGAYA